MRDENLAKEMCDVFAGSSLDEMRECLELWAAEQEVRESQPGLFAEVLAILATHDAAELATMRADYSAEVSTILPGLRDCRCKADFARLVRSQFDWWGLTGGKESAFEAIGRDLVELSYKQDFSF